MPIIETKNLVKRYDKLIAVDNLNLSVNEGEIFGLLGPNGAGKSTTILMLATLLAPSKGSGTINGYDIRKSPHQVRKSIGLVFQDPSSDDLLTGYENLRLHALMYDVPKSVRNKRIDEVLKLVDLTSRKNDLVKTYSGGMRRRLEIARGLLHYPKILFLDEPTIGLDPKAREEAWTYIRRLVKAENITVILTTHYMEEADELCGRIAIIDKGKIVALDSPANLKKQIGHDVIILKAKNVPIEKLRKLPFVISAERKDGAVSITVDNAGKQLQKVLAATGPVETVSVHSPTLDDVFLHYASKKSDETAEGGWGQRIINFRGRK